MKNQVGPYDALIAEIQKANHPQQMCKHLVDIFGLTADIIYIFFACNTYEIIERLQCDDVNNQHKILLKETLKRMNNENSKQQLPKVSFD